MYQTTVILFHRPLRRTLVLQEFYAPGLQNVENRLSTIDYRLSTPNTSSGKNNHSIDQARIWAEEKMLTLEVVLTCKQKQNKISYEAESKAKVE